MNNTSPLETIWRVPDELWTKLSPTETPFGTAVRHPAFPELLLANQLKRLARKFGFVRAGIYWWLSKVIAAG